MSYGASFSRVSGPQSLDCQGVMLLLNPKAVGHVGCHLSCPTLSPTRALYRAIVSGIQNEQFDFCDAYNNFAVLTIYT